MVTYETDPGVYTIQDLQEAVHPLGHHEGTLKIEYDDFSMKTKLILICFGPTFGNLGFDENSFSITLLGFTPYCDYIPSNATHADSPGVYSRDKILEFYNKKIHLRCDVFDGYFLDGVRQHILYSFFK